MQWYEIDGVDRIDTPALVLYKDRVLANIRKAVASVGGPGRLRPHVKTNKIAEVCRMMMDEGITKFKCATIAEAEMLGMIGAPDVLLAYQPVDIKAERFLQLTIKYPQSRFSCIVDNIQAAKKLSSLFSAAGKTLGVFIDLNVGMNRTGTAPAGAKTLIEELSVLPALSIEGLHGYDGHVKDADIARRKEESDHAFRGVQELAAFAENALGKKMTIISGGSPTFSVHMHRDVECSPGTFVFWDWGYASQYLEQPYEFAALVIARVISVVSDTMITIDLGYKSVASESPMPRVHFLNAPDAVAVTHSEEHLGAKVPDSSKYAIGDLLYGVPVHICPTVALYDEALVVEDHQVTSAWRVTARGRKLTV